MPYLYETHMHTCQASACGVSRGSEHIRYYKELGYTGIIITDHFFGGNTRIDRTLPWEERIRRFLSGYEDAKREGDRLGLDVFFGLEQNFEGDEYLVYGLSREFLMAHPEMEHWTRRQQLEQVHRAGGCVIQAHPFRIRGYMDIIRLAPQFCDGIEAANAGNEALDDARALRYGREKGMVMTAGSDNHHSPASAVYGVWLEKRLTDIQDYVRIILNREPVKLQVPEERFVLPPEVKLDERHLAWILNDREQACPAPKQWTEPAIMP